MALTKEFGEWERDRLLDDLHYRQLFFFSFLSVHVKSKRGLGLREPVVQIFLINSGLALEPCVSWNGRRLCLVLLGSQQINYRLGGQKSTAGSVPHPVPFWHWNLPLGHVLHLC